MKLNPTDLHALLERRDFKMLPVTLATEETQDGWAQVIRKTVEFARHLAIWEAGHRVAQLMETYPRIQDVSLAFAVGHDDDPYLDAQTKINGNLVRIWISQRHAMDDVPGCEDIDGARVLCETAHWVNNIGSFSEGKEGLSLECAAFNLAFDEPITSPQDARERAREHAPLIEAWVKQSLLAHLGGDEPDTGHREGARPHKM